jgi:Trimethylamine methyltransferase (MTTB)
VGTSWAPRTPWSGYGSASTGRCCPPPPTTSGGSSLGGKHTTARAGEICAKALAEYQQPLMDKAVRAELEEFVTRRRAGLGD